MPKGNSKTKLVSISYWYLLFRVLISVLSSILFILVYSMIFIMIFPPESKQYNTFVTTLSVLSASVMLLNYILYWKMSGIFVNDAGDHIVRWGGFIMYEDTLLNGVVVANQIERGPIDQLLNMANLKIGRIGRRRLIGVRYNELEAYNDRMRSGSGGKFATIF